MRRTSFERGLADLHGADVLEGDAYETRPTFVRIAHRAGVIDVQPSRPVRRPRVDHIGFRIGMGLMGLFWVIVLGALLVGIVVVAAVFGWAALTS